MPTKSEWKVIGWAVVIALALTYIAIKANQGTQDAKTNPGGVLGIKA